MELKVTRSENLFGGGDTLSVHFVAARIDEVRSVLRLLKIAPTPEVRPVTDYPVFTPKTLTTDVRVPRASVQISQETLDEIRRVSEAYPDGVNFVHETQRTTVPEPKPRAYVGQLFGRKEAVPEGARLVKEVGGDPMGMQYLGINRDGTRAFWANTPGRAKEKAEGATASTTRPLSWASSTPQLVVQEVWTQAKVGDEYPARTPLATLQEHGVLEAKDQSCVLPWIHIHPTLAKWSYDNSSPRTDYDNLLTDTSKTLSRCTVTKVK